MSKLVLARLTCACISAGIIESGSAFLFNCSELSRWWVDNEAIMLDIRNKLGGREKNENSVTVPWCQNGKVGNQRRTLSVSKLVYRLIASTS